MDIILESLQATASCLLPLKVTYSVWCNYSMVQNISMDKCYNEISEESAHLTMVTWGHNTHDNNSSRDAYSLNRTWQLVKRYVV